MTSDTLRESVRYLAEAAVLSMDSGMRSGVANRFLITSQAKTFREIENLAVAAGVAKAEVRSIIGATLVHIANTAGRILLEENASPAVMEEFDRTCMEMHNSLLERLRKAKS